MKTLLRDLTIESGIVRFVSPDELRERYLSEDFLVEYDPPLDLEKVPGHVLMVPYLLNVAPLVWAIGGDFSVPQMDAELFHSLERVREYFPKRFPQISWQGQIHADELIEVPDRKRSGYSVLFTQGIDSTFSALAHQRDRSVLVHVLRTHGIHARGEIDERCRAEIARQAEELGISHRFIRSNYQTLMDRSRAPIPGWFEHVQHGVGLAGLALPIAWEEHHEGIVVASSEAEGVDVAWGSHRDLEGNILAYGVGVESHGFETSRQQKTAAILAAVESGRIPPPRLKVCLLFPFSNCGDCEKCLRTVTAILVEGYDPTRLGFGGTLEEVVARARKRLQKPTGNRKLSEAFARYILLLLNESRARALQNRSEGRYEGLPPVHREFTDELANTDLVAVERAILAKPSWSRRARKRLVGLTAKISSGVNLPARARRIAKARIKRSAYVRSLALDCAYDFRRFLRNSAIQGTPASRERLRSRINVDYHKIEKGLSIESTRVGFGADGVRRLLRYLPEYERLYGVDDVWNVALTNLFAYYEFNRKNGLDDTKLYRKLVRLMAVAGTYGGETGPGGIRATSRDEIQRAAKRDLTDFFASRHSIRNFAPGEVDPELVRSAVRMAQRAPSVCNRQSAKVYVLRDEEEKRQALALQGGNRGFGDQADVVMIVTSDVTHFVSPGERNQCWIDGGLFAMSLVYALHSLGLGTCCLNWAKRRHVDRELKAATGIPESEAVIMMLAVGRLPDSLHVAQSPRKRLEEVLIEGLQDPARTK